MKCDALKAYKGDCTIPVYGTIADAQVYLKKDVDAAIAELKKENERLKDELDAANNQCENLINSATYIMLRQDKVNDAKCDEVESLKATHYADMVDANMENRRLKRALWLARALRAEARKNYWYARSIHEGDERLWSIDGSAVKYIGCIKRTNFDWLKIWCEVEIKCLAMAEKFK